MAFDELDRKILVELQRESDQSLEALAKKIGSSKTPVWNRVRKLKAQGVIKQTVAILDAEALGLLETFFVSIRTDQHSQEWLDSFAQIVAQSPEIQEVHRLTGEIDYLLKVRVENSRKFDEFYKGFIGRIDLFNVTSALSVEVLKETTALKV